jgi:primary-amine oxidase
LTPGRGLWAGLLAWGLLCPKTALTQDSATAHPLDPLTAEEIAAAAEVLRADGRASDISRFQALSLHEPPKEEVLAWRPGQPLRREALALLYDRSRRASSEAVVDLHARKVVSWKDVPGVQPAYTLEDLAVTAATVRADPSWREAVRRRGIPDFENVQIEPGPAGYYGRAQEEGKRLARAVSYYRGSARNAYARPVEGLVAVVDLDARKIVELIDTGTVPVPAAGGEASAPGPVRPALPLQIVQPKGVGFEVRGHEVRWQNWRFRYGMLPREGVVLYTVGYEDAGSLRPVLYRASLSEMLVPYADPGPAWSFRNAFDVGEYGLGRSALSLELLSDAPSNAVLLDATLADESGRPLAAPRAVALFERDGGLLWKVYDYLTGHQESRRARELVLSWQAAAANYAYGFNWVFHQDGTLEMEVLLTGVLQVKAVTPTAAATHSSEHGHFVARDLEAVHHQHFFNFRLDLDVDGTRNSVVEMNTRPMPPGPGNREGTGFVMKETLLRTEREARRQLDLASSRAWKVINPAQKNRLRQPVGYVLVPAENTVPYAQPASWIRKRAGFVGAHLWVTPYDPAQTYAAGDYVSQSRGGGGLPTWTRANRALENQDVVLWYTLGVTHLPRPEDWPVMSVHRTGFKLVPAGFFSANPALDVARPE